MRARLALMHCGAQCILREVLLKDKPAQLLEASSKATIPVLLLPTDNTGAAGSVAQNNNHRNNTTPSYRVIDESIDIMQWAMNENPLRHLEKSEQWLISETMSINEVNALIRQNDIKFKDHLDKYKYSDRHPEHPQAYYLEQAMPFLEKLERKLSNSPYLGGSQFRFVDAAILPFIRQFSMVEPKQFTSLDLPRLQRWLAIGLESDLFISVMHKVPQWKVESADNVVVFGNA